MHRLAQSRHFSSVALQMVLELQIPVHVDDCELLESMVSVDGTRLQWMEPLPPMLASSGIFQLQVLAYCIDACIDILIDILLPLRLLRHFRPSA